MADENTLMRLSALFDGELPIAERAALEVALARDPALRRAREIFEKLASSAAALPVPEAPQWQPIAARTTARDMGFEARLRQAAATIAPPPLDNAMDEARFSAAWRNIERRMRAGMRLERAAAALRAPELNAEAASRAWAAIQARTEQRTAGVSPAQDVPPVSDDKWKGVWSGIEGRIARKASAAPPVRLVQPVFPTADAGGTPALRKRTPPATCHLPLARTWHPWRWASAAALAAGLLIAVLVSRPGPAAPPEPVALLLPEVRDSRYMVSVRYVDSQPEPVVCYFLKKGSADSDVRGRRDASGTKGGSGAPPDGSYGFSQMK